jgi:hypothetical protein
MKGIGGALLFVAQVLLILCPSLPDVYSVIWLNENMQGAILV